MHRSGAFTHSIRKKGLLTRYKNRIVCRSLDECGKCFKHSLPENELQYLQQSIVPTMHFQDSLPRLPIPDLHKTCERYINSQKPLLTSEQLQNTLSIVETFKRGEGKELQEALKASDSRNKHTSYISEPWFDMYLKSRSPLVLNYNPFLSFKDDPEGQYNTQLIRSTNMIVSSLRFFKSLQANLLEPEIFHLNPEKSDSALFRKTMRLIPRSFSWYGAYLFKAFPLDMSQFSNLFSSTRIPHAGKDEIRAFPDSRHIAVFRNGNVYIFDVLDDNGNILPPNHVYSHINYILSDNAASPHTVSVLTTEDRDKWAEARDHLEKLGNTEQLRLVDSAIFVLALDDDSFGNELVKYAHQMLHGPANNRWFDKSFTLIITKDGKAAINFEHAWGDGVAVMRYFNEIFKDSTKHHFVGPETVPANVDSSRQVKRLDFMTDEKVKIAIKNAEDRLSQQTSNLQLNVLRSNLLPRESIKRSKLSPDSVAQLGFQMAFYKLFQKFSATYESCSTSAFKHGRTETVRPLSMAVRECVTEFHKASRISDDPLRGMLSECTKVHNQLTKEAAMGEGFDRHLFGLRVMAEKRNAGTPALFQDPAFVEANHFVLSTSTLHGFYFSGGGFGPVVEDGFGIGYGFMDDQLGCLVSSYGSHRDGAAFVEALDKSLQEISHVLSKR